MTITKTSKRAKEILSKAVYTKVFSLSNGFTGKFLMDSPAIRRNGEFVYVSQGEFLATELADKHCKLSEKSNGIYTIHVHSNLWYEFETDERKGNNPYCDCGCAEG